MTRKLRVKLYRLRALHRKQLKRKKKRRAKRISKLQHDARTKLKTPKRIRRKIYEAGPRYKDQFVKAPVNFSLVNNYKGVLLFFDEIYQYLKENPKSVVLDFSRIDKATPDAIALLLAKLNDKRFHQKRRIMGIRPHNENIDRIFYESGFYKIIGIDKRTPSQGIIHTRKNTIVDREVAVEARKLAASKTYQSDKKLQPIYRTLIECMANTKNHAKGESSKDETWLLAVYNDPITKITSFSFIDTGVGIFKSANVQTLLKVAVKLGLVDRGYILKCILQGKVESSTGLIYRGKGLPKIYNDFRHGHLQNLHIISNNVFANLSKDKYETMKKVSLYGTFLYWEVLPEPNNLSNLV